MFTHCSTCGFDYPKEMFYWRNKDKTKKQSKCKTCHNKYQVQQRTKRVIESGRFVCNYLIQNPCIDCGEDNILVLDFHHRIEENKRFNVGKGIRSYSLTTLKKEIAKCDVLCSNCHRIRHLEYGDNYKAQFLAGTL